MVWAVAREERSVATTNVAERGPHVSCLSCGGLYFSANSANYNAKTELRLA